jgi:energy-coupling factor transport system substrate-specific component
VPVSQTWLRVGGGLAAFVVVALVGGALLTSLDVGALDSVTAVTFVAVPVGIGVYALVEYLQTGRLDSIARQLDTRTLTLMAVAIALNAVLGAALAHALKIPIYLDSVGTVLVGVLGGPIAGATTGFLSNVISTFHLPQPNKDSYAAAFAIVSDDIGLLAGVFARLGWLRPRPGSSGSRLLVGAALTIATLGVMASVATQAWLYASDAEGILLEDTGPALVLLGLTLLALVIGSAIGLVVMLVRWRDLAAAYILLAGVSTGIVAALIASPIVASVFGGVTGSGADFVIAAFRQAGAELQQAVLGQSLISDTIDKTITYFVVYLILGAMATRTKARFPQGRYLLPLADGEDGSDDRPSP